MLDFDASVLEQLVVHRVGNKSEDEGVIASDREFEVDEELNFLLRNFFFKPFKKINTFYRFDHNSDVSLNELNVYCKAIFEGENLVENSVHILNHLYDQSLHPHIKSGELMIAKFSQAIIDDEVVDALGIFKIERKESFLKFKDSIDDGLMMDIIDGVNLSKLDKGAIIFNTNAEDGFKLAIVDSNNYDTQYWMDDFLHIKIFEDKHFHTKNAIEVCKQFADEVIKPNNDAIEHANFMNQSMNFFQEQESFDMNDFAKEVIKEPEYIDEFKDFSRNFEETKGVSVSESFDIAPVAVKEAKRKIKNTIDLDTNMQIKLDFNDPESAYKFLERGFDKEKGMYYYKVFFNREDK